ncbi:MAG: ABC transporter permease [Planctomycetes bacterium]|nr:ABC transporter permease [Planctomycetota bacterium]
MGGLVASLGKNRRLLSDLVSRDLRARYVGSSMGFFWSVLFPVINLAVYMFVFRIVLKMRWSDQQGTAEVSMLMLAGILVWHAFAESTSRMTNALVENQNLIQKVVFPSEVLPVYLVISSLVNMLIGLVIALFAVGYFAYVRPEARPGDDEKPVALWSAHAGETPRAGNGVVKPGQVRCATRGPGTEVAGLTIVDRGEAPWTGSAASAAGDFEHVVPRDLVYAPGERWAMVKKVIKTSGERALVVDGWRDARGEPVEPPVANSQIVVVAPPSRPLALSAWLLVLPGLVALQGLLMLGLGYLLSAFNLFLRDTYHVIGVLLTVWMFATPIFYPEHLVEDAGYGWVLAANPMHWLIESYREVLIYGSAPDWADVGRVAAVAAVLLLLGSAFFMKQKPRFPDLL